MSVFTLVHILIRIKTKLHRLHEHTHCKQTAVPRWFKSLYVRVNTLLAVSPAVVLPELLALSRGQRCQWNPALFLWKWRWMLAENKADSGGLHRNNRHEARNLHIRGWMAVLESTEEDGAALHWVIALKQGLESELSGQGCCFPGSW